MQSAQDVQSPFICSTISDDVRCAKRKRASTNEHIDPFLEQIKSIDDKMMKCMEKNVDNEKDEATLFCNSLIPVLRDMEKRQLRLANLKIQQLLYHLKYADN